jgi:predicted small integral membrane protein
MMTHRVTSTCTALRASRMALVAMVALFFSLVALGNLIDYGSNFAFVVHVLSMDDTFRSEALMGRAITTPALHHAAYALIIGWQIATALLCWWGLARLWCARRAAAEAFHAAKGVAIYGLTAGMLLYGVGFLTVGGEWFAMWQSSTWNGQNSAHMFFMLAAVALLHLCGRELQAERT